MTTYQEYKQLYHNLPKPISMALHHEDITDHPADMQILADLHDYDPEGILPAVIAKAKDLSGQADRAAKALADANAKQALLEKQARGVFD